MSLTPAGYASARPFPHAVLDVFPADVCVAAGDEFPSADDPCWGEFANEQEKKLACEDLARMGPVTRDLLAGMAGLGGVLEWLTGIGGLVPSLYGGGMHLILPGGHLDLHTDFNFVEDTAAPYRRLNSLLYLNDGWDRSWGGELVLGADGDPDQRVIVPAAGTLVVFTTSDRSFHGHPRPLACPSGRARKSLAVYWFTGGAPDGFAGPHGTVFV